MSFREEMAMPRESHAVGAVLGVLMAVGFWWIGSHADGGSETDVIWRFCFDVGAIAMLLLAALDARSAWRAFRRRQL